MEEAYMRESTRKVFSLAEDIFLAAQLRLLFPLGTTSQNNIQKSFIRQKEPAMEKGIFLLVNVEKKEKR